MRRTTHIAILYLATLPIAGIGTLVLFLPASVPAELLNKIAILEHTTRAEIAVTSIAIWGLIIGFSHWIWTANRKRISRILDATSYAMTILGVVASAATIGQYADKLKVQRNFFAAATQAQEGINAANKKYFATCPNFFDDAFAFSQLAFDCISFKSLLQTVSDEFSRKMIESHGSGNFPTIKVPRPSYRDTELELASAALYGAIENGYTLAHVYAFIVLKDSMEPAKIKRQLLTLEIAAAFLALAFGVGFARRIGDLLNDWGEASAAYR